VFLFPCYFIKNFISFKLDIAHDLKDLDKIRQSIEIFASEYPLSPPLWMRYLKTEISLAQTDEEIKKIQKMFQRALDDYYSIDIALEYSNLAEKCSDDVAVEVWNDLLPAYGYDFTKGRLIWAAWRKDFMRREKDSPEKFKRIIKKYKEELLLPLDGMEITYKEFQEFIKTNNLAEQVNLSSVDDEVKSTKKILIKVAPFEKFLAKLEDKSHHERVETFKRYIETCAEELEEEYVQILHERMITACCLNESVWMIYLNYIKNRPKDWEPLESNKSKIFKQTELEIINRALRNCDWSANLYVEKIQLLETLNSPREEVKAVLEKASSTQYNAPEPLVKIWIEYLTYLTRVTNFDDEKQKEILRKNFDLSWNALGYQFGDLADCDCEILKFWSCVEYSKLNDHDQGKQLFNTAIGSNENAKKTALWIEFAQLEQKYRGNEAARVILKRAIKVQDIDDFNSLASFWTRFERCNGTPQHLKICQETCESALAKRKARDKKNLPKKPPQSNKRKAEDEEGPHNRKKQAVSSPKEEFQKLSISKPPENDQPEHHEEIDTSKDHLRIFISNLNFSATVNDLREGLPEISIENFEMIKNKLGKSLGYGYAELSSEVDVEKALKLDRRMLNGRPIFISRCERDKNQRTGFKFSTKLEPNKIFVKGLAYSAKNEDLQKLYKEFGKIKDIRIVTKRNGQSKGCAYVEFEDEKAASHAVFKTNDIEFLGRTLSVAISAPPAHDDKLETTNPFIVPNQPVHRSAPRTDQKSRLSFVPASVQKASVVKEGNGTAPKSNSDFRKMFMK
jgi:RNA recognition motif-containing protein